MFFNKSSSFTVAAAASDAALDCALLSNRLAVFNAATGFASATLNVAVFCCSAAELAAGAALFPASAAVLSAALATADESAEALELCRLTTGTVEGVSASTLWLPPM